MKDTLLMILFFFSIILIIYLFITNRQKQRRKENIYGFNFPDWSGLYDEKKLIEIADDFKSGFIARTLIIVELEVADFHSHLKHINGLSYTGFIKLDAINGFVAAVPIPNEIGHRHLNFSSYKKNEFRYFLGHTTTHHPDTIHVNSYKNPPEHIPVDLNSFDDVFGKNNWDIIIFKNKIYVLTSELFEEEKVKKLLSMGLNLQSKI